MLSAFCSCSSKFQARRWRLGDFTADAWEARFPTIANNLSIGGILAKLQQLVDILACHWLQASVNVQQLAALCVYPVGIATRSGSLNPKNSGNPEFFKARNPGFYGTKTRDFSNIVFRCFLLIHNDILSCIQFTSCDTSASVQAHSPVL
jgi:hypothetical protein